MDLTRKSEERALSLVEVSPILLFRTLFSLHLMGLFCFCSVLISSCQRPKATDRYCSSFVAKPQSPCSSFAFHARLNVALTLFCERTYSSWMRPLVLSIQTRRRSSRLLWITLRRVELPSVRLFSLQTRKAELNISCGYCVS